MNTDYMRSEHRLPRLCAKPACSLFGFIGLKARWAHRPEGLCFNSAHAPRVFHNLNQWQHSARPTILRPGAANLVGQALRLPRQIHQI
jgi:hypothetical protein